MDSGAPPAIRRRRRDGAGRDRPHHGPARLEGAAYSGRTRQFDRVRQGAPRNRKAEGAPLAGRALPPDPSAMHFHQLATDGEPEAGALILARHAALALRETLANTF